MAKWREQIRREEKRRTELPEKARIKREKVGFGHYNRDHVIATEEEARRWEEEIRNEESRNPRWGFEVTKIRSNSNAKFTTYFDTYVVKVNHPPVDAVDVFLRALNMTVSERGLVAGDKVRLIVSHKSWSKPFSTKLLTVTGDDGFMYSLIKAVLEFVEYKEVPLNELLIEVQSTKIPRGSGRLKIDKHNIGLKKSVITIRNTDSMCLARAIVTAMANINKTKWTKSQIKNGFNGSRKLQETEATKLHEEAGVDINEFGNTLEDVNKFARHLGVQINIVDGDQFNELIHTTEGESAEGSMIYMYKNRNHFDVITSMPGFLCKDHYCHTCKKSYKMRDTHKCPTKCLACFKSDSGCRDAGEQTMVCGDCNRTFYGHDCFEEHKRNRGVRGGITDIVCKTVQKCLSCKRTVKNLKTHICGYSKCSNCKEYSDPNTHKCYMLRKPCKGGTCTKDTEVPCNEVLDDEGCEMAKGKWCMACKTRTTKYMFYDFETQQDTGKHIVNWVHAWDFNSTEYPFQNIEEFCELILVPEFGDYTFIAHNSKGFDAQFILKYCVENGVKPYCIYNGTKIMYMDLPGKKRFIDSLNFVASGLAAFPKTFGLKELRKGYFPHYFNRPENQCYVGAIPDTKYYGPDQMSSEARTEFLKWHQTRSDENYVFDLREELRGYCRSDVDILRRSMMKFREDFLKIANIDPLCYITIASVCAGVYRDKFIPHNDIAVVKDVEKSEVFSAASIKWLKWVSETQDVYIQHALNGGEHKIPGVGKVDGYCETTNTVYEFHGCFWHGCPKCYSEDTINPYNQTDMRELHEQTQTRGRKITEQGYDLVEVRECEVKDDAGFRKWSKVNWVDIVTPLNPRAAFFGGRTNVSKLRYDFKDGEKGRYVDFVSLYPTVQFYKKYPVGHPTKIHNPENFDPKWFGFVKCKVDAPRGLYHPVLPVRTLCGKSVKLLFPLCRTCGDTQQQTKCQPNRDQRSFVGTWCTNEIHKALEKGYEISKIYEVWHFNRTSDNLFKEYVRDFMRIKMESSKPPKVGPNCTYKSVEDFKGVVRERLGITLGDIDFNPGMRAISKLCLNSLWGKFGQRINQTQTVYVVKPSEFYKVLLDDTADDLHIQFINDDMVQMNYRLKDEFVDNHNNTNIFIAAFTTSHAREMLYGVLDKLGDQVLGYDTDSAWYVDRPGGNTVETGNSLGDLTDELEGDHINKWYGTGPKSYGYKTHNGKVVCKVKGFTLNYENKQKINAEVMDSMIRGTTGSVSILREETKTFSLGYNKRVIQENYDTLPYGY